MSLSYLTKKNWHPSNMDNVRAVYEAELKVEQAEKKRTEHIKRLKEEKQIEDLKRIQVKQGLIPESSLNMIEWMYQDRSAFNKTEQTAEEYLLGKEVKEGDLGTKTDSARDMFVKGLRTIKNNKELQESYTTNENEAFLRMKEDPLMLIKAREMEMRNEVLSNPMTLKKIQKEIALLKEGKAAKKKHKHKHHRRSRSRSGSSDSRREDRNNHHRHEKKHNSEYERLKAEAAAFKSGYRAKDEKKDENKLGPDMTLYASRQREIEEQERLKKAQNQPSSQLTQAEKEAKAVEMIARAEALAAERREQSGGFK
jgi:hypothetical protein